MTKPYVICHMCTSIDGKILSSRWPKAAAGAGASTLFETTADSFNIPAWIVGTTTMKEFAGRGRVLKAAKRPVPNGDFIVNPAAKRLAIGVDRKGVLRFDRGDVDGDAVVILTTTAVGQAYRAHLRAAGVSYLLCGAKDVGLKLGLQKLGMHFGVKKLMLEGGGTFNGAMLHAGLIDEISQVTVPVVDGGSDVSGFFDIPGRPPRRAAGKLKLISHKRLADGVTWNRYRMIH